MESLPTQPAIDRERIVPDVCMVDNRSGLFWLVSSTGQVYVPARVMQDSSAQHLMLGKSSGGRLSELPVRFISRDRPLGSSSAVLASVAGFSGVLTWPDDLLEGNMSADDTLVYEDVKEVELQLEANRLVEKAWSEASLPAEPERASADRLVGDSSAFSPLVTTHIAWKYSQEDVCLLDLFGGISTGLAAVLQSGWWRRLGVKTLYEQSQRRLQLIG
ncbi:hypothetical protein AXG93_1405s1020 [Marchantia polymorpha subsp. ruderalis]|uniref:Uncharacterized protein n=1 Tax=Marchantia polymorpha subsp. ruderalis TaxID=1480154 RepID=A0A176VS60_MARPO|nr:hypothetical protein AXG93_1405s1020 [Marchantia polymorpha subsp. ruderalis]